MEQKEGTSEIHDPDVYNDKALRLGLVGTRPTGALALMSQQPVCEPC